MPKRAEPAGGPPRTRRPTKPEPVAADELIVEPRMVGGLKVVSDEPMPTNLSRPGKFIASHGTRVLTLEDGSTVHACADPECDVTGTRGEVQAHRWRVHGVRNSSRKVSGPRAHLIDDHLVVAIMSMPVGELVELAGEVAEWEHMFEVQRQQFDDQKERQALQVAELSQQLAAANKRIRVFENTFARLGFVKEEES